MDVWGGYKAVGQAAEEEVSGEGRTRREWKGGDRESNEGKRKALRGGNLKGIGRW